MSDPIHNKKGNSYLDKLLKTGDIKSYSYENVDEDGNVTDEQVGKRNSERLSITLPSGKVIHLTTFCSGCLENTSLEIREGVNDG